MSPVIIFHIAAATVSLGAGVVALASRKGGRVHAWSGGSFVAAMLTMFASGVVYAFHKTNPSILLVTSSVVGGQLVATAWRSARRRDGKSGRFEQAALAVAFACVGVFVWLSWMAWRAPSGHFNGVGQEIILPNLILTLLAAGTDLRFVLKGRMAPKQRIARHVWRVCTGMFLVVAAVFLGGFGQKIFIPQALHGSMLLPLPPLGVLVYMAYWLVKLRFGRSIAQQISKLSSAIRSPRPSAPAAQLPDRASA